MFSRLSYYRQLRLRVLVRFRAPLPANSSDTAWEHNVKGDPGLSRNYVVDPAGSKGVVFKFYQSVDAACWLTKAGNVDVLAPLPSSASIGTRPPSRTAPSTPYAIMTLTIHVGAGAL